MRQNASLSDLLFNIFSTVTSSIKLFQIPLECTSYRPYFQRFLSSSNFQYIALNSVRLHSLASLISKVSQQFQLFLKSYSGGPPTPDHFPISSTLYLAHATPLVTYFARMQPIRLKLPNMLDRDDKC